MNTKIKVLNNKATVPTVGSPDSAGMDLYSAESVRLCPNVTRLVSTGIAVEIPRGYVGIIRSRSGLKAKNSIDAFHGTIDADYRGELKVMLTLNQFSANMTNDYIDFPAGSRIAQLVVLRILPPEIMVVNELSNTERGEGGFGHTGV